MKDKHLHGDLMTLISAALATTVLGELLSPRRGAALRILHSTGIAFDNMLADLTGRPRLDRFTITLDPFEDAADLKLSDVNGELLTMGGFDMFVADHARRHVGVAPAIVAPHASGGGFVQHAPAHRSRRPGAGGDCADYFGDSPEIDD